MELEHVLKQNIPIILLTNSKSSFDFIVKSTTQREKLLFLDAYENFEIHTMAQVLAKQSPADALTTIGPHQALNEILATAHLTLELKKWVERTTSTSDVERDEYGEPEIMIILMTRQQAERMNIHEIGRLFMKFIYFL